MILRYICVYVKGWRGHNCSVNIDECVEVNACLNGATCTDQINDWNCTCLDGWVGKNCETDYPECDVYQPCQNGGTCREPILADYVCDCVDGYEDKNCTTITDNCAQETPCAYGICHNLIADWWCECESGWDGERCNQHIQPGTPSSAPSVVPTSATSFNVSFTFPGTRGGLNVTSYHIYYRSSLGDALGQPWNVTTFNLTDPDHNIPWSGSVYEITNLVSGLNYSFRFNAENPLTLGNMSATSPWVRLEYIPTQPNNVGVIPLNSSSARVSWSSPSSDGANTILAYRVTYWYQSSNISGISVPGTFMSVEITGLANAQNYTFQIQAQAKLGYGFISSTWAWILYAPTVPRLPSLMMSSRSSLLFTWSVPADLSNLPLLGYETQLATDSFFTNKVHDIGLLSLSLQYDFPSLSQGTSYYARVRTNNSQGYSSWTNTLGLVLKHETTSCSNVTANVTSSTSVVVTWRVPSDNGGSSIANFTVYYADTTQTYVGSQVYSYGNTLSARDDDTGLRRVLITMTTAGNIVYYFSVTATNAVGESVRSILSAATPLIYAPTLPTSITSYVYNQTGVSIAWHPPADNGWLPILGYTVEASTSSMFSSIASQYTVAPMLATDGQVRTLLTVNFLPTLTYYWRVYPYNAAGIGAVGFSTAFLFEYVATRPDNVTVASYNSSTVIVGWTKPTDSGGRTIINYLIQIATDYAMTNLSSFIVLPNPDSNGWQSSIILSGLTSGRTYYVRLASETSIGYGAYTSILPVWLIFPPLAPDTVTARVIGTWSYDTAEVTWLPSSDIGGLAVTNWTIAYATHPSFISLISGTVNTGNNATNFNITGLISGATYWFKVAACNNAGCGPYSTRSQQGLLIAWRPMAPYNLTQSSSTSTSAIFTWSAPLINGYSPLINYVVTYSHSFDFSWDINNVTTRTPYETSVIVTSLQSGSVYYWRVTAVNVYGWGIPSSPSTLSLTYPPRSPTLFTAKSYNSRWLLCSWTPPVDQGGLSILNYTVAYSISSSWSIMYTQETSNVTSLLLKPAFQANNLYVKVAATNARGRGPWSAQVAVYWLMSVSKAPSSWIQIPEATPTLLPSLVISSLDVSDGSFTLNVTSVRGTTYFGTTSGLTLQAGTWTGSTYHTVVSCTLTDCNTALSSMYYTGDYDQYGFTNVTVVVMDEALAQYSTMYYINTTIVIRPIAAMSAPILSAGGTAYYPNIYASWSLSALALANVHQLMPYSYQLQMLDPDGIVTLRTEVSAFNAIVNGTDVIRATTYQFRVRARNGGGWSDWSAYSSVTTLPIVPEQPSAPSSATAAPTSLTIFWTALPTSSNGGGTVTSYRFLWTSADGTSGVLDTPYTSSGLVLSPISSNTAYTFRVMALNSIGFSLPSASATFTSVYSAPSIISLTASDPTSSLGSFDAGCAMTIVFDMVTNRPAVSSAAALDALFDWTPNTIPTAHTGAWSTDGTTLTITIAALDSGRTLAAQRPQIGLFTVTLKASGGLKKLGAASAASTSTSPPLTGAWGTNGAPVMTIVSPSSMTEGTTFGPLQPSIRDSAGIQLDPGTKTNTTSRYILTIKGSGSGHYFNGSVATSLGQPLAFNISGSLTSINTKLQSIYFIPLYYYFGSISITFTLYNRDDLSYPLNAALLPITYLAADNAPVLTGPTTYSLDVEEWQTIGASYSWFDADYYDFPSATLKLTALASQSGLVRFPYLVSGVSYSTSVNETALRVELFGTLPLLNQALTYLQAQFNQSYEAGGVDYANPTLTLVMDDKANGGTTLYSSRGVTSMTVSLVISCLNAKPPLVQSAQLADTGAVINVVLDRNVLIVEQAFDCSLVFDDATMALLGDQGTVGLVSVSSCKYVSATTLTINFGSYATIVPGQNVTIRANGVRRFPLCNVYVPPSSTLLLSPANPPRPSIQIIGASYVSLCESSVTLLTTTFNMGGRAGIIAWTLPTNFQADTYGNASVASFGSSIVIPMSRMLPEVSYTFSVVATNYIGLSTSATSHTIKVQTVDVPTVRPVGSNEVTISRSEALSLHAVASWSPCVNLTSLSSQVQFSWSSNVAGLVLGSSKGTPTLTVPALSMAIGTYSFALFAWVNYANTSSTSINSTISYTVTVVDSGLVAKINGGTLREVSRLSPFTLDATSSYDPDLASGSSPLTGMSFIWSCRASSRSSCVNATSGYTIALQGSAPSIGAGVLEVDTYVFTLIVTKDIRQSTASITITVLASGLPLVQIVYSSTTVNPSGIIKLSSQVEPSGSYTYRWSVITNFLDLNDGIVTSTRTSSTLLVNTLENEIFTPATSYRFRLDVTDTTGNLLNGAAELSIYCNSAPDHGRIVISPVIGTALTTQFSLSVAEWEDPEQDTPLTFVYYYVSNDGSTIPLTSRTSEEFATVLLPYATGGTLTVGVTVYDQYLASTSRTEAITIQQPIDGNWTAVTLTSFFTTQLTEGSSVSNSERILALVSSVSQMLTITNQPELNDTTSIAAFQGLRDLILDSLVELNGEGANPSSILQSMGGLIPSIDTLTHTSAPPLKAASVNKAISLMAGLTLTSPTRLVMVSFASSTNALLRATMQLVTTSSSSSSRRLLAFVDDSGSYYLVEYLMVTQLSFLNTLSTSVLSLEGEEQVFTQLNGMSSSVYRTVLSNPPSISTTVTRILTCGTTLVKAVIQSLIGRSSTKSLFDGYADVALLVADTNPLKTFTSSDITVISGAVTLKVYNTSSSGTFGNLTSTSQLNVLWISYDQGANCAGCRPVCHSWNGTSWSTTGLTTGTADSTGLIPCTIAAGLSSNLAGAVTVSLIGIPIPVPTIFNVRLAQTLDRFTVLFNGSVSFFTGTSSFISCHQLFGTSMYTALQSYSGGSTSTPICTKTSDTSLIVSGLGDLYRVGDTITFAANAWRSLDGYSVNNTITSSILLAPPVTPQCTAVVSGPQLIGTCGSLTLNASLSRAGTSGRSLTYTWSLDVGTSTQTGVIPYLTTATSINALAIVIPSSSILTGSLAIQLTVQTWTGSSASYIKTLTKSSLALPDVAILGVTYYSISRYQKLILSGSVTSQCADATTPLYQWSISPNITDTTIATSGTSLTLLAATFQPATTYWITLIGTISGISSSAKVQVDVASIPAPVISYVRFDDDMGGLSVKFDSPTNRSGGLDTSSDCNAVFTTSTVSLLGTSTTPTCSWVDAYTLNAQFGPGYTADLGSTVSLWPNVIYSWDQLAVMTTGLTQSLDYPTTPPTATALVTGPVTVGQCDAIGLNAGLSYGGAGRSLTYQWNVTRSTTYASVTTAKWIILESWLASTNDEAITIPNSVLVAGVKFEFTLTATNWIGSTSTSSISVLKSVDNVPSVYIADSITRTVLRTSDFEALAVAALGACDDTPDTGFEATYLWYIISDSNDDTDEALILSEDIRTDLTKLYIPALTFVASSTYTFRVKVSLLDGSGFTNTADLTVTVLPTPLIALIVGGNRLISLYNTTEHPYLTIDGSQSNNPDDTSEVLVYTWSCYYQTSTVLSLAIAGSDGNTITDDTSVDSTACFTDASVLALISSTYNSTLIVPRQYMSLTGTDEAYVFTMVINASNGETSSASVSITTSLEDIPEISLATYLGKFDVTTKMYLLGPTSDSDYTYLWSNPSSNFDITNDNYRTTAMNETNLVLAANVLTPNIKYTFALSACLTSKLTLTCSIFNNVTNTTVSCDDTSIDGCTCSRASCVYGESGTGSAAVTILTNRPPTSGYCYSSPSNGTYDTTFQLICKDWTDEATDFPFTYSFIMSTSSGDVALTQFTGANRLKVRLPSGIVMLTAQVRDASGAVASYQFNVTVFPPSSDDALAAAIKSSSSLANLVKAGDSNSVAQAIIATSSLLSTSADGGSALSSRQSVRSNMLDMLTALSYTSNTTSSITQRLSLMSTVTSSPTEIDATMRASTGSLLQTQTSLLAEKGVTASAAGHVLSAFDNVMTSASSDTTQSTTVASSVASSIIASFNAIARGLTATTLSSESATTTSSSTFSVTSKRATPDSLLSSGLSSGNTTFAFPSSLFNGSSSASNSSSLQLSFTTSTNNYYSFADNSTNSTSSGVVSFSLFLSSGNDASIKDTSDLGSCVCDTSIWSNCTNSTVSSICTSGGYGSSTCYDASERPQCIYLPIGCSCDTTLYSDECTTSVKATCLTYRSNATCVNTDYCRWTEPGDGFIDITIPNNEPVDLTSYQPVCRYWNESSNAFAFDGCFVRSATSTYTICACTHLTSFNTIAASFVPSINTISVSDILNLTWANIMKHPLPFMTICIVYGSILLIGSLVYYRDKQLDRRAITLLYRREERKRILAERFVIEENKRLAWETQQRRKLMWNRIKFAGYGFLQRHLWTGIFFRLHSDSYTGLDRLVTLVSLLIGTLGVGAIFYGQEQSSSQELTIGIIMSVSQVPICMILAKCFMSGDHSRMADFIVEYYEDATIRRLKLVDQSKLTRRQRVAIDLYADPKKRAAEVKRIADEREKQAKRLELMVLGRQLDEMHPVPRKIYPFKRAYLKTKFSDLSAELDRINFDQSPFADDIDFLSVKEADLHKSWGARYRSFDLFSCCY
jgi:hypothetical protein